MAGDWIKMRHDLHEDPSVIGIAEELGLDEFAVVGRLHKLWSWGDVQTINGNALSVTPAWLDRYVSAPGFAQALSHVDWLCITSEGITIPKFNRHISESAKQRALTAKRAAKHRNAKRNDTGVTKSAPREEKRREENTTCSPPLPPELDTPELQTLWADYLAHRAAMPPRDRLTERAAGYALKRLAEMGPERAKAALLTTLEHGWKGIREPDNRTNHRTNQAQGRDNTGSRPGDPGRGRL